MHVDDTSDSELVESLRARKAGAFDAMYRRYGPRIWAFLVRLSRDHATAEDLYQETWIAAARRCHELAPQSDLRAWLFTIARNKHRSHGRFLFFDFRRRAALMAEASSEVTQPDEVASGRARAAALERALAQLAEPHREVLLLCVIEGLETSEVAQVLGLKDEAVRKRLSRARAELADRMKRTATMIGAGA